MKQLKLKLLQQRSVEEIITIIWLLVSHTNCNIFMKSWGTVSQGATHEGNIRCNNFFRLPSVVAMSSINAAAPTAANFRARYKYVNIRR